MLTFKDWNISVSIGLSDGTFQLSECMSFSEGTPYVPPDTLPGFESSVLLNNRFMGMLISFLLQPPSTSGPNPSRAVSLGPLRSLPTHNRPSRKTLSMLH